MDIYNREKKDVILIKKELSDELIANLRNSKDDALVDLVYHGYTLEELINLIAKYSESSGADLVNCNEIVKKYSLKNH